MDADQLAVLRLLAGATTPMSTQAIQHASQLGRLRAFGVVLGLKRLRLLDELWMGHEPVYALNPAGHRALRRADQIAMF